MADAVTIRVPKDEKPSESPPPSPFALLKRFRRVLALPLRIVWHLPLRLWKWLFGPRPKP